ncbi:ChaN family lipoprotein [Desulfosarcina sp.]|uniref:ChaN family lipoprotein n=1 Tax=Desulfosarcina sp. TaxID=2027861 RepID=UPI003970BE70
MAHRLLMASAALVMLYAGGCAVAPKSLSVKGIPDRLMENTILNTATGSVVSREQLIADLTTAEVVYVGESHTNPVHHAIQLDIIKALVQTTPHLVIGMEMFDHTYQPVLDRWTSGELETTDFIEKTHWYANWRFDFDLYRDILEFAKEKGIRVVGLNVPFHIPARISVGGIDNLSADDRRHLPRTIDTTDADHRAYVEEIFNMHTIRGREKFTYFYEAQCTWEDAMAEAVAKNTGPGKMVVLAGNGHIIRKFGIPKRAFSRTRAPFKTVYLAPVGGKAELTWADYLWSTSEQRMLRGPMHADEIKKP